MSAFCSHNVLTVSLIRPSVSVRRYGRCDHFIIAVALIHNDNVVVYTFGYAVAVAEEYAKQPAFQ